MKSQLAAWRYGDDGITFYPLMLYLVPGDISVFDDGSNRYIPGVAQVYDEACRKMFNILYNQYAGPGSVFVLE